jgi:hypothetical protein
MTTAAMTTAVMTTAAMTTPAMTTAQQFAGAMMPARPLMPVCAVRRPTGKHRG